MPSPTLGMKRVCPSCGARFYDLNKKPISCPKCAFSFEPDVLLKPRRPRTPEKVKPVEAAPVASEDETPDYEEETESEETVEDEADESESETETEAEPALAETSEDEEEGEGKPAAPAKRRGATEEVDPDLIEVDEDEALDSEEEEDDTLIEPDEEEDSDLSDIEIEKDDEDR